MVTRVLMPKGSDTMTEGKVLKWIKHEGDAVSNGDAIVEIETDKVDMEVESMGEGVLRKVLVKEGEVVPVGQLLAVVAGASDDIAAVVASAAAAAPKPSDGHGTAAEKPAPAAERPAAPAPAPVAPSAPIAAAVSMPVAAGGPAPQFAAPRPVTTEGAVGAPGGRILASPLARRIAKEKGIDLSLIAGSGPGGRITRQDVDRMTAPPPMPAPGVYAPGVQVPPLAGPEIRDEPLTSMRKVIAARLAQSLGPVPHFYLTIEVDMKRAKELRESAASLDANLKLSYNDIILKACAAALRQHPEVNASFLGDKIRYFGRVHLGMAVAVEGGGLITPVIRDADRKTLPQISHEAKELATRARNRKLNPDEYVGATFSVSNLGMMGIEEFSAVINPPEGAILAVGAVVEKPVVVNGHIEVGHRCRMTLSCDHRVVDGATGAKFLQTLQRILENPVYLVF